MTRRDHKSLQWGVYEKALPVSGSWGRRLEMAAESGFDFFELAIDPSAARLDRLNWTKDQRAELVAESKSAGVAIRVLTLSYLREIPLGSADLATRERAALLLAKSIALAVDVGAEMIQVPGYFVFSESQHPEGRRFFCDGLRTGAERAGSLGLRIGLENMDGQNVTSVTDAVSVLEEVDHPALGLHIDVGNLAGNGCDVPDQIRLAGSRLLALDLKDARRGEFRRVPFGQGLVPWSDVFSMIETLNFAGPMAVEMWNDDADSAEEAAAGLQWLRSQATRASS